MKTPFIALVTTVVLTSSLSLPAKTFAVINKDPVEILKRWEMPEILREISGISYLDKNRIACIQDETGTIYIYNTTSNKIEKEIHFTSAGDFEDLAIAGETIYVIRADGKLFEITNFNSASPDIQEYSTGLTIKNDVESLHFDAKTNRLLLMGKAADPDNNHQKQIYAFDLKSKSRVKQPFMSINTRDKENENNKGSKRGFFKPSALSIHPKSGNIYITDGPSNKLFIVDRSGTIIATYNLQNSVFPQAEGISFSPSGEIYISTEGKKEPGAIVKVAITEP